MKTSFLFLGLVAGCLHQPSSKPDYFLLVVMPKSMDPGARTNDPLIVRIVPKDIKARPQIARCDRGDPEAIECLLDTSNPDATLVFPWLEADAKARRPACTKLELRVSVGPMLVLDRYRQDRTFQISASVVDPKQGRCWYDLPAAIRKIRL